MHYACSRGLTARSSCSEWKESLVFREVSEVHCDWLFRQCYCILSNQKPSKLRLGFLLLRLYLKIDAKVFMLTTLD